MVTLAPKSEGARPCVVCGAWTVLRCEYHPRTPVCSECPDCPDCKREREQPITR